jgi:Protein of unknown function (DUF3159)
MRAPMPQCPSHPGAVAGDVDATPTDEVPVPGPGDRPMTLLERVGWPWGVLGAAIPQVVFAVAIVVVPLLAAAGIALAVALVQAAIFRVRGEPTSTVLGGVFGVAIASGIAVWTGSASNFFLVGIVAALVGLVATTASVVVRRPLTGLAWNALHGGGHAWRQDRPARRAHDVATLAAAAVFGARFVVTQWLYGIDSTGGLAIAKVVMGTPMTLVAAVVAFWAFRRSTRRLITPTARAREGRLSPG